MSDDNEDNKVHGFEIDPNGHHNAFKALGDLSERDLKEKAEIASRNGKAHVTLKVNGAFKEYKLTPGSGGKLKIHEA